MLAGGDGGVLAGGMPVVAIVVCDGAAIEFSGAKVVVVELWHDLEAAQGMISRMRRWTVLASDMASVRVWAREAGVTCAVSWCLNRAGSIDRAQRPHEKESFWVGT